MVVQAVLIPASNAFVGIKCQHREDADRGLWRSRKRAALACAKQHASAPVVLCFALQEHFRQLFSAALTRRSRCAAADEAAEGGQKSSLTQIR